MNPKGLKKTFHLACRDNIYHLHSVIVRNLHQPTRWGGVGRTSCFQPFFLAAAGPVSVVLGRAASTTERRPTCDPADLDHMVTWPRLSPCCSHSRRQHRAANNFFLFLLFSLLFFLFNASLSAQRHLGVPPGLRTVQNFVQSDGRKLLRYEMSFCPAGPVDNISSSSNFSNYLPSSQRAGK